VGEVGIQRQGDWRRPALYQHWFLPMFLVNHLLNVLLHIANKLGLSNKKFYWSIMSQIM
jgi:hypothetical protein